MLIRRGLEEATRFAADDIIASSCRLPMYDSETGAREDDAASFNGDAVACEREVRFVVSHQPSGLQHSHVIRWHQCAQKSAIERLVRTALIFKSPCPLQMHYRPACEDAPDAPGLQKTGHVSWKVSCALKGSQGLQRIFDVLSSFITSIQMCMKIWLAQKTVCITTPHSKASPFDQLLTFPSSHAGICFTTILTAHEDSLPHLPTCNNLLSHSAHPVIMMHDKVTRQKQHTMT